MRPHHRMEPFSWLFSIFNVYGNIPSSWRSILSANSSKHWICILLRLRKSWGRSWCLYVSFIWILNPETNSAVEDLRGEATPYITCKLQDSWSRAMARRWNHQLLCGEMVLEVPEHSGLQYLVYGNALCACQNSKWGFNLGGFEDCTEMVLFCGGEIALWL